ncbi:cation diffusion facilitator family transporter [Actinobaculum suis]|uniref:cation diffusion facilitator family transporter n=1 Tax=Actinobaculum suis TaxID=1657 RepID=UPI0008087AC2|nr:cation diffusion facilitator family transporter [Actinobaculum suis]OCA94721.1 cation transporter [Actinobaculum suis]OCA95549.1 cation transporter [Actinobaculum suis]
MGNNHAEHAHSHGVSQDADRRYLWGALILLVVFMLGEVVVAFASHSLALLSDAAHMLTDTAAIAIAIWVSHVVTRPATKRWTFGLVRAEILSGLANGATLLILGVIIVVEAVQRFFAPPEVSGWAVVITALAGVVVNVGATALLARANRDSLNIRGAYQHILTDLYGFIGTAVAGVIIVTTGWVHADAIASLIVAFLMLHAGWGLVRDAGHVLLEGAPANISVAEVREHITGVEGVLAVHDLHLWSVGSEFPVISAHIVVEDEAFYDGRLPHLLDKVQDCLQDHFDVEHSTFQFEPAVHSSHEPRRAC